MVDDTSSPNAAARRQSDNDVTTSTTPLPASNDTAASSTPQQSRIQGKNELIKMPSSRQSATMESSTLLSASARSKLLFGDSSSSVLAPATRFPTEASNSQQQQQTNQSSDEKHVSLFGAVMQNVQQTTPAKAPKPTSLTDFLETLSSPFATTPQTPGSSDSKIQGDTPATLGTPINDWIEYDVGDTIDWSIYNRLELQTQPKLAAHNIIQDDCTALQDFSSSTPSWGSIQYYWEHPAVPMPPEQRKSSRRKRSFHEMVRQQDSFTIRKQKDENDDEHLLLLDPWSMRKKQWQEAFRSLYFKFKSLGSDGRRDAADDSMMYFYAHSMPDNNNMILFRWKDGQPHITIRKCGLQFREQVRARGATLWVGNTATVFTESLLQQRQNQKTVSPSTKAELTALRRAQMQGQTVGADIAVVSSSNNNKRQVPVLSVRGVDDCDAVWEVYMNTYGQILSSVHQEVSPKQPDVPRLVCRHLGPFLHGTLRQLRRADASSWVGPPVLPCMVRELQHLAVAQQDTVQHWLLRGDSGERSFILAWDGQRPDSVACKVSDDAM